jgi:predicted negative regulator of RcsB-dependent stress response
VADYQTDEEQIARLKTWWDENGLMMVTAVVLSISAFVGWRWYDDYRTEAIAQASDLYQDFLTAEGEARTTIVQTIEREASATSYHALMLLQQVQQDIEAGNYQDAESLLRQVIEVAPEQILVDLASLRLARVLQQLDRSDDALRTLATVRGEGYRSQVAELKGDIHIARSERSLAHEAYSAALTDLGDGVQRPLLEMKVADTADADDS